MLNYILLVPAYFIFSFHYSYKWRCYDSCFAVSVSCIENIFPCTCILHKQNEDSLYLFQLLVAYYCLVCDDLFGTFCIFTPDLCECIRRIWGIAITHALKKSCHPGWPISSRPIKIRWAWPFYNFIDKSECGLSEPHFDLIKSAYNHTKYGRWSLLAWQHAKNT